MEDDGGAAATAVVLAVETLGRTGQLTMRAHGASMLPSLWPGDELQIDRCASGALAPGDLVLFRRDARLFVHRVLRVDGDGLIARGDALSASDPRVPASDVLGKVVSVTRQGRAVATSPGKMQRLGRLLLRNSSLATRLALRWHRKATPTPA